MAFENIRISQQAKAQLIKLKRFTGIENWNVLCRWGYCMSLAEPGVPLNKKIPSDSNVEMSWRVFGGQNADLYMELLKIRLFQDGIPIDNETLNQQFRLHLHRGIAYLAAHKELRNINDLISLSVKET